MTKKTIDWTKPIQTRDGLQARAVCTDMVTTKIGEVLSVVVLVKKDGVEKAVLHHMDGQSQNYPAFRGVVNAPETHTVWMNVYPDGVFSHESKESADRLAGRTLTGDDCLGQLKVEYEIKDGKPQLIRE